MEIPFSIFFSKNSHFAGQAFFSVCRWITAFDRSKRLVQGRDHECDLAKTRKSRGSNLSDKRWSEQISKPDAGKPSGVSCVNRLIQRGSHSCPLRRLYELPSLFVPIGKHPLKLLADEPTTDPTTDAAQGDFVLNFIPQDRSTVRIGLAEMAMVPPCKWT